MAHSHPAAASPRGLSARVLDFALPVAILLAVMVVLAPVPPLLVDLLLTANLTISVLALLGALAARTPLEMSVFPTFVLGSTLVRLVLNIATTRLVLSRAAIDGAGAAGEVVHAFGEFVAANNLVVGAVIFAIIAIIQFVVITAGTTRTSEVAARFALDGLPGRQMAIDAEAQAGAITREQATHQRQELQRQADFFASMDGASRFVRGEAVAGVIITLINLLGGLAIGVLQHGMPLAKALDVYSRLTIGDGLVSAVPSLFVSVATGLLISRSSQAVDLSRELGRQFVSRPQALLITSVFLGLLSLTDLPFLPLFSMAVVTMAGAWWFGHRQPVVPTSGAAGLETAAPSLGEEVLGEERIVVELGQNLIGLVTGPEPALIAAATALRGSVAADLGIVVPAIAFRDCLSLPRRGYRVMVAGETACEAEIPAGKWLALAAVGETLPVDGVEGVDPGSSRRGRWVGPAQAETAKRRGATVLDDADCLIRALEGAVRRHADTLLSRDATSRLIESLRARQPSLVEQIVPGVLSIPRIHRALQSLLRDGVPIRPLAELLEIMSDHAATAGEPAQLAEAVRRAQSRTLCRRARDTDGKLRVVILTASAAETLAGGDVPRAQAQMLAQVRRAVGPRLERGAAGVVVVPGARRLALREILCRNLVGLTVLAEEEVAGEVIEVFATLGAEEIQMAA